MPFISDIWYRYNVTETLDLILHQIQSGVCLCKIKVARQIKLVAFVQSHMNIR